jgi:hypothetical protein
MAGFRLPESNQEYACALQPRLVCAPRRAAAAAGRVRVRLDAVRDASQDAAWSLRGLPAAPGSRVASACRATTPGCG